MESRHHTISLPWLRLYFLFFIILLISYGNTFHASWQLDDKPNILNNPRIHITDLSTEQIWQSMHARPGIGGLYRPIACVTFALNWFIGKSNVLGYHIVNFAIHLWTTWFLFLTIIKLFSTPRLKDRYPSSQVVFIAGLATLLWALNPMQTEAVTYIVQRMASLAGMFAVLAIYFYLRAKLNQVLSRRSLFFILSAGCYLLGLLSKENVALLPLSIPVFEFLFFCENSNRPLVKRNFIYCLLIVSISILIVNLMRTNVIDFILKYYANRPFTLEERLLTEPRIVLFYLTQLFFPAPSRLSIEHDITLSTSLFSPWTTIPAILVHICLLYVSVRLWRKQPLVSLSILFFYLNHIIESTIVPLELIFEHRNYLPSIFLFLPVAQLANAVFVKIEKKKHLMTLATVLLSIIIGAEGYATYTRNKAWHSEKSLWLDALAKAPRSARPLAKLAIMLAWGDHPSPFKYRKALEMTKKTLSLRMHRHYEADQLGNIASIYDKLGQHENAIKYYNKALSVNPKHAMNRYNLAKSLARHGDFKKAVSEVEIILKNGYLSADYYGLMGVSYLWLKQPEKALAVLRKALKLAPDRPDILLSIGSCMSKLGFYERAQWFLKLAQDVGGRNIFVSLTLIQNELLNNDRQMAVDTLKEMLASFPLTLIIKNLEITEEIYSNVPIDRDQLKAFIFPEIKHLIKFSEQ